MMVIYLHWVVIGAPNFILVFCFWTTMAMPMVLASWAHRGQHWLGLSSCWPVNTLPNFYLLFIYKCSPSKTMSFGFFFWTLFHLVFCCNVLILFYNVLCLLWLVHCCILMFFFPTRVYKFRAFIFSKFYHFAFVGS